MRIFTFIITLILAAACVFLNVLGYNGSLAKIEYILISGAAELLLCFLLGHFMYRTYANHKRAKNQTQELTNAQAALALAQKNTAAANDAAATARAERDNARADLAEARAQQEEAKRELALLSQKQQQEDATETASPALSATRSLAKADTAIAQDLETTTLFKTPLA